MYKKIPGGMPFAGTAQAAAGRGGSGNVEIGVLAEAKGKAQALYYVTLEVGEQRNSSRSAGVGAV